MALPLPALLRHTSLRKRLWQGGVALAIFVLTIAIINSVQAREKSVTSDMLGHDFLPFYTAGTFINHGMSDRLYDLNAVREIEHKIATENNLEIGKGFGPFWNPPFYAWVFAPLARLPYREALFIWTICNVAALLAAMLVIQRMLGLEADWRSRALVPLLILVSMPFIQAISHGQNTFGSLLLVSLIATAWRMRRPVIAGALCGLLSYKPQLAMVLAAVMTLDLGWRAMAGTAFVGAGLLAASAFTLPGTLHDYMVKLPENLRYMQIDHEYLWERHVTLKGFWRLLLQGRTAGETSRLVMTLTITCSLAVVAGLLKAVWTLKQHREGQSDPWSGESSQRQRDRLIAATICATPLLMPFYFDYDLLLLAVPVTLLASEFMGMPIGAQLQRSDTWLIRTWTLTYLWLLINPGVANSSHINGTVIGLSVMVVFLISRASRNDALPASMPENFRMPLVRPRLAA